MRISYCKHEIKNSLLDYKIKQYSWSKKIKKNHRVQASSGWDIGWAESWVRNDVNIHPLIVSHTAQILFEHHFLSTCYVLAFVSRKSPETPYPLCIKKFHIQWRKHQAIACNLVTFWPEIENFTLATHQRLLLVLKKIVQRKPHLTMHIRQLCWRMPWLHNNSNLNHLLIMPLPMRLLPRILLINIRLH